MKRAILVHGRPDKEEYFDSTKPAPSNSHWFPWVQRQLLLKGILAQTPEMPDASEPNYEKWKQTFEQFKIDEETILIGHSCGGGFIVRWLSENKIKVGKVILVAPWLDPEHNNIDPAFFRFDIDPELASRTAGVTVMYSTDDYPDVLESVEILRAQIKNVVFQEFTDKGHFVIEDMKTEAFPELVNNL
jgi:predicted alpha/beta hydrolase family esterase